MGRTSLHWHWLTALAGIAITAGTVAACNGAPDPTSSGPGGSDGSPGGSGATGADSGDDGFGGGLSSAPEGCNPPCAALEVCSVAGQCIEVGTCLADGDCGAGRVCDGATKTCIPGGDCGGTEVKAAPVAPNLLLVLDRSCSMTDKIGGKSKWDIAVAAIQAMTSTFQGQIRFGLTMFPDLDGAECAQGAIPLPVGPDNEGAIQSLLAGALVWGNAYWPGGPCVTNIDAAVQQATTEPALTDPERESYVLLITDGQQHQGCDVAGGDEGTVVILGDLFKQGVSTFVLGFGSQVSPTKLNQFAEAGGVPATGATKFYNAEDAAGLESALASIAEKTLGCTFALDEAPPDASEIYVFFDDSTSVPRDPAGVEGWDYDAAKQQITFHGGPCEMLKSGKVADVDIVFGCPEPVAD